MATTHEAIEICPTLHSLIMLRDIALYNVYRYRWDPQLKQIHEQYFDAADSIIEAYKGVHHAK